MSLSQSDIELDQDDITARLSADSVFSGTVKVLERRKGVIQSDVQTALGAANQNGQKMGLVAIVLMPKLIAYAPNAPGPQYYVRYAVQVIDWPAIRQTTQVGTGAYGAGITAETLAQRVRMVIHGWATGRGQTLVFDGLADAPLADDRQVSYLIYFRRQGADPNPGKCATVSISATSQNAGATITLTCATAGANIYYTTDGTLATSASTLYSAPFPAVAGTLRCTAVDPTAALADSDAAQSIFT